MKLNAINGFILDDMGRIVGEVNNGEKTIFPEPIDSPQGNPFWDTIQGRGMSMGAIPDIDQFRKNEYNRKMAKPPKQYQAFPNLESVRGLLKGVSGARSI